MNRFRMRPVQQGPDPRLVAAQWALRMEEGNLSPAEAKEMEAWLDGDECNQPALEDANWALDVLSEHAASDDLRSLREKALAARPPKALPQWKWASVGGAIAASTVAALLFTPQLSIDGLLQSPMPKAGTAAPATYRTAVGERAAITLPDGSVATLDTDSLMKVAFRGNERSVYLMRGQALFDVAKEPRQFKVYAKDQRITAVGTIFNVRIDGERVRVALLEGVVRVRSAAAPVLAGIKVPVRERTLAEGELLDAGPQLPVKVQTAAVEDLSSWKNGLLVFNDMRLADAVNELNRYNENQLYLGDSSIAGLRVSGVFKANDPERFAQAIADLFSIQARSQADGSLHLHAEGRRTLS